MEKKINLSDKQKIVKLKKMLYELMVDCVGDDLYPKKAKVKTIRKAQVLLNTIDKP